MKVHKPGIVISSDFLMIANRILADSSIAVIEVRPATITSFLAAFVDRESYKEFQLLQRLGDTLSAASIPVFRGILLSSAL